jgi:hypothetical protein
VKGILVFHNKFDTPHMTDIVGGYQLNMIIQTPGIPPNCFAEILGNIEHSIKFGGNDELAGVVDEKVHLFLDGYVHTTKIIVARMSELKYAWNDVRLSRVIGTARIFKIESRTVTFCPW